MYFIPYNSTKEYHKNPFGAVCRGTEICFRIVLPKSICCKSVLLVYENVESGTAENFELRRERSEGDNEEWWIAEIKAEKEGIFNYHFELNSQNETLLITKTEDGFGKIFGGGAKWQQTVFSESFKTPEWLKGGIIYQIFPDRFFYFGEKKEGVWPDRTLRENSADLPNWQPDEFGRIKSYDYFCGDLKGIESKLDYIASLGVNCIYLNPIFEAHSNHRYDTADYEKIDPLLGTEENFKSLCKKAEALGIGIILDGVFSHTGADSKYFNKQNRYSEIGAYNSKESPYYSWYKFSHWPERYSGWWGIDILPEVDEENETFIEYIAGENGIAARWLESGARGWRLDVADELPDKFLNRFYQTVKNKKSDAVVLGEVWEDASNKQSYGMLRKYLLGSQMDSVMNYPFANAVLNFASNGDAEAMERAVMQIVENYPKPALDVMMNHIGTHDTVRVITRLSGYSIKKSGDFSRDRGIPDERQLKKGKKLLRLAAAIQFTLPGVACIYYGDEAGLCGGEDPYNRRFYPWGNEDKELLNFYRELGRVRRGCAYFSGGSFRFISAALGCVAYERFSGSGSVLIIANRNEHEIDYILPEHYSGGDVRLIFGEGTLNGSVTVPACSAVILQKGR